MLDSKGIRVKALRFRLLMKRSVVQDLGPTMAELLLLGPETWDLTLSVPGCCII